jgi:putative ABC transport system permease protein
MGLAERLRQVLESLRQHPRRVAASAMGVFWGAAGMLVLMSFGTGFREYMRAEFDRYGPGAVLMYPAATSSGFPGYRKGVQIEISRSAIAAAARDSSGEVAALLPEHRSQERLLVEAGGRVRRLDMTASDPRFAHYRNFAIAYGRFFDATEHERRRAVAVLGHEAAEDLFGEASSAVGETLRIEGQAFELIGVAAPKSGFQYINTNRPDDRLLMLPASAAEARLGYREEAVSSLLLFPRPGVDAERAISAVLRALGPRAGFHPDDLDAVKRFDLASLLGLVDLFYAGFMAFTGIAGTITLMIGGVGIANYHLATIAERTVEIAVAKAVGARSRTLVTQVILESTLVSAGSAGLGVLLGLATCVGLILLAPPEGFPRPIVSGVTAGVTFAATLGVAIVAAVAPALRVRRIEISAALRAAA